ncbi:exodeoxyribonuclease VII small subunit [Pseudodesulfovibrio piezophilus]|uniref:Exodeoxyribonuclease 7 small subunit n=1 Tax=Pseudodesulfovibrio piezophilus (strain DSM 21447 / JCM 15486 / C1TLV30) TaxID=1322246 RepID=M1WQ16_PSEP2|nr:exodeoxyribonuclease VII small subunit [Pseudodesulfovibrio piezophilus]CCH48724.1 Exodeoxyribonuclease 7 small subunit [Pseudodesulfovibrio piezophilus C1TLV30]
MAQETFENRLDKLKSVVERLERGDLPLEEGVALYKEGLKLTKACGKQLENARHEVKLVSEGLVKEFEALETMETEADDD